MPMRPRFTTSRSIIVALAFISLLSSSLIRPPNARARFCSGDRELIRYYLQSVARIAGECVGSIQAKIIHAQNRIASYSGNFFKLAIWASYIQSREILAKMLIEGSEPEFKMPTLPAFKSALKSPWNQVISTNNGLEESVINCEAIVEETLAKLGTRWSICQAASTRRLDACKLQESLDPQSKSSCRQAVARISILYAGRCSEENVQAVSETLGFSTQAVERICKIAVERKGNLCDKLAESMPTALPLCRAMTGKGESACKDPELSDEQSKLCLGELATFLVVNRELDHSDWVKKSDTDYISNMVVKVLVENKGCHYSILQQYDQLILRNFSLGTKKWYQLPTMLF